MSTTAEQIAALESALASGVLTVSYNGRSTTYRSAADLVAAINYFKRQQISASARPGFKVTKFTNGGAA
jgi:hypothetical protein